MIVHRFAIDFVSEIETKIEFQISFNKWDIRDLKGLTDSNGNSIYSIITDGLRNFNLFQHIARDGLTPEIHERIKEIVAGKVAEAMKP